jgi:hypothetical protein
VHLDCGYDSGKTRDLLDRLGFHGEIAAKGEPRRFTDRREAVVESYLDLAAALTVIRRLTNRARTTRRWPTRPTTRRLRRRSTAGRSQ